MMKKIFILLAIVVLSACSTNKSSLNYSAISQQDFLKEPFGFEESISNFKALKKPKFDIEKALRKNTHYPEKTDTIYKFKYKQSVVYFYKTHLNQEFLLTGKIVNKKVKLKNGIEIGIKKSKFEKLFAEKLNWQNDSLSLQGQGTLYTFYFQKDKLSKIKIDNYVD